MNCDFKEILCLLMKSKNITVYFLDEDDVDFTDYDGGLRKLIFGKQNSGETTLKWIQNTAPYTLYHLQDIFFLHSALCTIPKTAEHDEISFFIGPYLLDSDPVDIAHIIERNELPLILMRELRDFYSTLPHIQDIHSLEHEILTFLTHFYPQHEFTLNGEHTVDFYNQISETEVVYDLPDGSSVSRIEKIYEEEEHLLHAVAHGDYTKAFEIAQSLLTYRSSHSVSRDFSSYKQYVFAYNILFSKEVQRAKVHPVYVDKLSVSFVTRIESTTQKVQLTKIYQDMLRKYCMLVQNHSLQGYSKIIQDTLNYMDLHLTSDLSLRAIAQIVGCSPNYLSSQFKKEIGKTLTDFVNEKRIEKSILLLTTTNLQIQEISEKVGIQDENYFSRLFKKIHHMSAREYRNMLRANISSKD